MSSDWLGICGRVSVISGAGGGIGRSIAQSLAEAGSKVVILDHDIRSGEETAERVRGDGGEALAIDCDITDHASVQNARNATEQAFGPCDILVNNAALVRNGPLAELSLDDWNAVINVNLTGFFLCSQVFGEAMRVNGKGSIVHVASLAGSFPQPTSGAYSVSKAGVMMLSRNLAIEWGKQGVRSNVVSPAMVLTPMSKIIYADEAVKKKREQAVPVGRIGMPQDIADAICFLASDRATYISGQEILVDGGWSASILTTVPRPGFDVEK